MAQVLHLGPDLGRWGDRERLVCLAQCLDSKVVHVVWSEGGPANPNNLLPTGRFRLLAERDFPACSPGLANWRRLASAMVGYDFVVTYGRGTLQAVLACTLFRDFLHLPPLIHHAGHVAEETWKKRWLRRVAMARISALVVPSSRTEAMAHADWQQPRERVHRIAPVVSAPRAKPRRDALPRLIKRTGECWLGTFAGSDDREAARLSALVTIAEKLPEKWHLVIIGTESQGVGGLGTEGPDIRAWQASVSAVAMDLGIAHRVHVVAEDTEPPQAMGLFDLYAALPDLPGSGDIPEAMALGVAVVTQGGDYVETFSNLNSDLHLPDYADIPRLACDDKQRRDLGKANRERASREFSPAVMMAAYRKILSGIGGIEQICR